MTERTVTSTWEEGLRCRVRAGEFTLTVDEPASVGGSDQGPQPTEVFLASIASCFTLAIAYSAAKRGVEVADLRVETTGTYDGPSFSALRLTVHASAPQGADLQRLITAAERVCYVTNTLRATPEITIGTA